MWRFFSRSPSSAACARKCIWADTGTRGGLGRAFRNSIFAKRCDIFLGLSDSGEDDSIPDRLAFTKPYISLGYVLVVQGKADGLKTLQELKDKQLKIGVSMSTPIDDYLFTNKIPRELYLNNRRIMEGMSKGEVDASMVWATAIAVAKQEFPNAKFHMVEGYVPLPEHALQQPFRRAQGRQEPARLRQPEHRATVEQRQGQTNRRKLRRAVLSAECFVEPRRRGG